MAIQMWSVPSLQAPEHRRAERRHHQTEAKGIRALWAHLRDIFARYPGVLVVPDPKGETPTRLPTRLQPRLVGNVVETLPAELLALRDGTAVSLETVQRERRAAFDEFRGTFEDFLEQLQHDPRHAAVVARLDLHEVRGWAFYSLLLEAYGVGAAELRAAVEKRLLGGATKERSATHEVPSASRQAALDEYRDTYGFTLLDQPVLPALSAEAVAGVRRTQPEGAAADVETARDSACPEAQRRAALGRLSERIRWKLYGQLKWALRRVTNERRAAPPDGKRDIAPSDVKRDIMMSAIALTLTEDAEPILIPLNVVFGKEGARSLVRRFGRRTVSEVVGGPVRPRDLMEWEVYWTWFARRTLANAQADLKDQGQLRKHESLVALEAEETSEGHEPEDPTSYFEDRVLDAIDTERQLARDLARLAPAEREAIRVLPEDLRPFAAQALPALTRKQRPILLAILQAGNRGKAFAAARREYSAGRKMAIRIRDRLRKAGVTWRKCPIRGGDETYLLEAPALSGSGLGTGEVLAPGGALREFRSLGRPTHDSQGGRAQRKAVA